MFLSTAIWQQLKHIMLLSSKSELTRLTFRAACWYRLPTQWQEVSSSQVINPAVTGEPDASASTRPDSMAWESEQPHAAAARSLKVRNREASPAATPAAVQKLPHTNRSSAFVVPQRTDMTHQPPARVSMDPSLYQSPAPNSASAAIAHLSEQWNSLSVNPRAPKAANTGLSHPVSVQGEHPNGRVAGNAPAAALQGYGAGGHTHLPPYQVPRSR